MKKLKEILIKKAEKIAQEVHEAVGTERFNTLCIQSDFLEEIIDIISDLEEEV